MSTPFLIFIVVSAVAVLLIMVLKLKISAFISLLITAIYVGIIAGMPLQEITKAIQDGMDGTLGFVAAGQSGNARRTSGPVPDYCWNRRKTCRQYQLHCYDSNGPDAKESGGLL